VDTDNH